MDDGLFVLLDATRVADTARTLQVRVEERFPGSGLSGVAQQLASVAENTEERLVVLKSPIWKLRSLSLILLLSAVLLLAYMLFTFVGKGPFVAGMTYQTFIGTVESTVGTTVFLTAALVFLWTLEERYKRINVLKAVNELRSLAHVIDSHQLTKDPGRIASSGPDTPSSPNRSLTIFQLGRYLDYCTEMLSLVSKVAALYAQSFPDQNVLNSVDQVESLATGLSRKIWQKIMLLQQHTPD